MCSLDVTSRNDLLRDFVRLAHEAKRHRELVDGLDWVFYVGFAYTDDDRMFILTPGGEGALRLIRNRSYKQWQNLVLEMVQLRLFNTLEVFIMLKPFTKYQ